MTQFIFLKAIKTKKRIENIKKAHIYDGAALTKYLFWLKKILLKKKLLKLVQLQKNYLNFRKKNKNFSNFQVFLQFRARDQMELLFIIRLQKKVIED